MVVAAGVIGIWQSFDDLDERENILNDALETLDAAIPCRESGVLGSTFGTTLVIFPAGKALLDDARLGLQRAKASSNLLDRFAEMLDSFADGLKDIDVQKSPGTDFQSILNIAAQIVTFQKNEFDNIQPDFLPTSSTGAVKSVTDN